MAIKCPVCGNLADGNFCSRCGFKVTNTTYRNDADTYHDGSAPVSQPHYQEAPSGYQIPPTKEQQGNPYMQNNYSNNQNYAYQQGQNQGYNQAYDQGYSSGYNQGYDQAYSQGYNQAYSQGYNQGYNQANNDVRSYDPAASEKSKWVAFFLCFFLGVIGVHHFYVGRIGMGILYIFTGGLFGIGWLVDIIMLACGSFKDVNGLYLKY